MTDRELLEFAAKAAGIVPPADLNTDEIGRNYSNGLGLWCKHPWGWNWWHPLDNDGDALRLAVKLGIILGTYENFSTVDLLSPNEQIMTITVWHHQTNNGKYAATRLAITRAAAEIGRAMP